MGRKAFKVLKVDEETHRKVRIMAAERGQEMAQVTREIVNRAFGEKDRKDDAGS